MKDSLLENIETYLIVTVITVMVWLYAEGENVRSYTEVTAQVRFVAPPGANLAITPGEPRSVELNFRSSTGAYGNVTRLVAEGPIQIPVNRSGDGSPDQSVVLPDYLIDRTPLGDIGLSDLTTQPEVMTVRVEPIENVRLPVSVRAGDIRLAGPPQVEPLEVEASMPESLANAPRPPRLEVRLDNTDLSALEVNVPHTLELPLQLPPQLEGRRVNLAQSTARVTFTIRKQTDSHTIPLVPILVVAPPSQMADFELSIDENLRVLRDVRVVGPSDAIERIRSGDTPVWAQFRLTASDLEQQITSAPLTLTLPAGVQAETAVPAISFTITPRNAAE